MPNTEAYDTRLQSYYSSNAAQAAWCMILPHNTQDVSRIAKIISKHQCPFGIRSGAHSAFKGSNGVKDGITVDFGKQLSCVSDHITFVTNTVPGYMNTTTFNNVTNTASIGPGSTWGAVYTTLKDNWNVTTTGGRASVVGVGGFLTGGGVSTLTPYTSICCPNLLLNVVSAVLLSQQCPRLCL